jgi:flagellar motor switch protein FliM
MSETPGPLRFALEGERVRRAASALEQASTALVSALRRSMPFLARRGGQITLCFARATPLGEILADLSRPIHATHAVVSTGARAAIVLDAKAISLVLDGVLGGDGKAPPDLDPAGLTTPQVALVSRVMNDIVRSLSEVFTRKFGVSLAGVAPDGDEASSEAAPIACSFEIGGPEYLGRVVLLVAKEALLVGSSDVERPSARNVDARICAVVEQVELDIVAELARVRMSVGHLSSLRVGDSIRLDVPVGAAVSLRADGHVVLRGYPTTSAGQIAIRIEGRHSG